LVGEVLIEPGCFFIDPVEEFTREIGNPVEEGSTVTGMTVEYST
jgi:hypothetical protein